MVSSKKRNRRKSAGICDLAIALWTFSDFAAAGMVFPIFKILLVLSSVAALLFAESKTDSSSGEIQGQLMVWIYLISHFNSVYLYIYLWYIFLFPQKKFTFWLDQIQAKNTENDVKIGHLEANNSESEAKICHLKTRNAVNLEKIGNLEKRKSKNEKKIHLLETKNAEQAKEITKLKIIIDEIKIETKPFVLFTGTAEPSSFNELVVSGYSSNGFYLVKNSVTKKIETVSCKFGTSGNYI